MAGLFAFDSLMPQDFLPLRKEFLVEQGFFNEVGHLGSRGAHARGETSTTDTAASMPHRGKAAIKCAATFWNSVAARLSPAAATIGSPRSPASRVGISMGIWPSRGT